MLFLFSLNLECWWFWSETVGELFFLDTFRLRQCYLVSVCLLLFLCIAPGTQPVTLVLTGKDQPPHLLVQSVSLGRSSILIHNWKSAKALFHIGWVVEHSEFWVQLLQRDSQSPCQDLKETKWSTFYCKSFNTAHIGISSFNMIYFFIQSDAVKKVCMPVILSAPRSLHLP